MEAVAATTMTAVVARQSAAAALLVILVVEVVVVAGLVTSGVEAAMKVKVEATSGGARRGVLAAARLLRVRA